MSPTRDPGRTAEHAVTAIPVWWSSGLAALGLAAGGTAGPLVAADQLGPGSAGLPITLLVAGSAAAAAPMGWLGQRMGRRRALAVGYLTGAVGAAMALLAVPAHAVAMFLIGSALLGAGNTSIFLSRYATADPDHPTQPESLGWTSNAEEQGRAMSRILTAISVGAVAGPLLIGPLDLLVVPLGFADYTGLYGGATVVYGAAALLVWGPRRHPGVTLVAPGAPTVTPQARTVTRRALLCLAAVNLLMVGVMTVAPVHLAEHGATPTTISVVVAVHVAAMFAPAPLSRQIVTMIGAARTISLGLVLVMAAGIVSIWLDSSHGATAAVGLVILGLGWNLGIVGGSIMLIESNPGPAAEAYGEISMGLAAATGAAIAGIGFAIADITTVWIATALLALNSAAAIAATGRDPTRRRSPGTS
ncbi:MAG: MFS transporter [Phycicoccus sp.]